MDLGKRSVPVVMQPVNGRAAVAVFTHYFVPGSKGGGPIRSLDALTITASDDGPKFHVITSDRDQGADAPYETVTAGEWTQESGREILYVNYRNWIELLSALCLIRRRRTDVYYFNSLWARWFTLIPLLMIKLRVLPRRPVMLAPRGELLSGALGVKSRRKRVGLMAFKALIHGLRVEFQATSDDEREAIVHSFPNRTVHQILDTSPNPERIPASKRAQVLRVVFAGRIHPHKNVVGAIEAVISAGVPIELDIIGGATDQEYMAKCLAAATRAPKHVQIRFRGHVEHSQLIRTLPRYDVFVLPTKGENFGHAIREALSAGCVVLVSDRTPWSSQIRSTGIQTPAWVDVLTWGEEIARLSQMPDEEYAALQDAFGRIYSEWRASQIVERQKTLDALATLARG